MELHRKLLLFVALSLVFAAAGCGGALDMGGDAETDLSDDGVTDESADGTPDTPPPDIPHDVDIDPSTDPPHDPPMDRDVEIPPDLSPDHPPDIPPDSGTTECSDGIDNDFDGLTDLEDFDCEGPDDPHEGPDVGECTNDNHCDAGWEECNRETNECYDPPEGNPCQECYRSEDCGDGVTGENPDRDFCLYWSYQGFCSKDCLGAADCPRGFYCDFSEGPGMCVPVAGTCNSMERMGDPCEGEYDCGYAVCHDSMCTTQCEIEHDCPDAMSCVEGWCVLD